MNPLQLIIVPKAEDVFVPCILLSGGEDPLERSVGASCRHQRRVETNAVIDDPVQRESEPAFEDCVVSL